MLSKQMQVKLIHDLYDGHDRTVDPAQLDEPWHGAYLALIAVPPAERHAALIHYFTTELRDYPLFRQIREFQYHEPEAKDVPSFADLADSLPPVDWLWPGWVPNAFLSCLAAPTGAGKSLIALDLARRVAAAQHTPDGYRGQAPDGQALCPRNNTVIYVDAENVPQINVNRARAWSMRLDRLYLLLPAPYGYLDLSRRRDQDRMIETVHAVQPGLVVIDSLGQVSSRGMNVIEDVRPLLSFLANLAHDAGCAVLLVHHTRKRAAGIPPGPMTADDLVGSTYIVAGSRVVIGVSVIQVSPEPDPNGPRRIEVLKTNLARYPEPLGCEIVPAADGSVSIRYVDAPRPYREPTSMDLCRDWLLDTLGGSRQAIAPKDLVVLAADEGFSRATLYRARSRLGGAIANTANPHHPDNKWRLASPPPAAEP